jgi:hypothetical protein
MNAQFNDQPAPDAAERRAARLTRLYPRAWRERYGEEFAALLVDDILERPRSVSRVASVVRCGTTARLVAAGLLESSDSTDHARRARSGTALVALSTVPFLLLGLAVWSQLTVNWQWSDPHSPATHVAMLLMSVTTAAFAVLALIAAAPFVWSTGRTLIKGSLRARRRLTLPLLLTLVGAVGLFLGTRHFGHNWPGTGGHPWAGRGLVPTHIASSIWAATVWITSYWAHPRALGAFPPAQIAWMLLCPVALVATLTGLMLTVYRGEPLSDRALVFETRVAACAAATMVAFLAGATCWLFANQPHVAGLSRPGTIDFLAGAAMAGALVVAFAAARTAVSATAALDRVRKARYTRHPGAPPTG